MAATRNLWSMMMKLSITLAEVLEQSGFAVTCATDVVEALKRISSESYDALLTDLHVSRAREGLTVVSALKNANPSAVTLLLSAFAQLEATVQAILLQADEVLARPMDTATLVDALTHRVRIGPARNRGIESVGAIIGAGQPKPRSKSGTGLCSWRAC